VALRMFLADSGVTWTDEVVSLDDSEEWKKRKERAGKFGTIPLLTWREGERTLQINEALAIASFLSQQIQRPSQKNDIFLWGESMQVVSKVHLDVNVSLTAFLWAPIRMNGVDVSDQVKRLKSSVMGTFGVFESKFFHDDRVFVCGTTEPTIGDYFLFEGIDRFVLVLSSDILDEFPRLAKFRERMRQRPNIQAFFDANPSVMSRCSGSPVEEHMRSELKKYWV